MNTAFRGAHHVPNMAPLPQTANHVAIIMDGTGRWPSPAAVRIRPTTAPASASGDAASAASSSKRWATPRPGGAAIGASSDHLPPTVCPEGPMWVGNDDSSHRTISS